MALPEFTYSGVSYDTPTVGTTTFNLTTSPGGDPISYLERGHIMVFTTVDDGETLTPLSRPSQWDFNLAGTQVVLVTPVDGSTSIVIKRETPIDEAYVTFGPGGLTSDQLNDSALFNLYSLQEFLDNESAAAVVDILALQADVTAIKANDWVTQARMADNSVGTAELIDDSVTAAKIAAGAVGSDEIAADAVGSSEIAAGAVGTTELADDSVTAAKIAAGAVGSDEIAADAVGSSEIAAGAVGTTELADGSVTAAKIASGALDGTSLAGFRNRIINGSFDVWQRGVGPAGAGYLADRWTVSTSGPAPSQQQEEMSVLRVQAIGGGARYGLRMGTGEASNTTTAEQRIEDVRTLANATATLSFWPYMIAGACDVTAEIVQNFGSGGDPSVTTSVTLNLPTANGSAQKFTGTVAIPSINGKTIGTGSYLAVRITKGPSNSSEMVISKVQLEPGSIATDFEVRPLGVELALCQRYYQIATPQIGGYTGAGTSIKYDYSLPTGMRATPTWVNSSQVNINTTLAGVSGSNVRSVQFSATGTAAGEYLASCTAALDAEL